MLNQKILTRIQSLGGNTSQVKGSSLADDLLAIILTPYSIQSLRTLLGQRPKIPSLSMV